MNNPKVDFVAAIDPSNSFRLDLLLSCVSQRGGKCVITLAWISVGMSTLKIFKYLIYLDLGGCC